MVKIMSKKYFFAEQKKRIDLAASFLIYINFILLVLVAYEDHFYRFIKIPTQYFMIVLAPIALFCMYLFGAFLDCYLDYKREEVRFQEKRSPIHLKNWKKIHDKIKEIKELMNNGKGELNE